MGLGSASWLATALTSSGTTEFGMGTSLTYGSNIRKITIPQQPQMGIATTVTCAPVEIPSCRDVPAWVRL